MSQFHSRPCWLLLCMVFGLAAGLPALRAEEPARARELRRLLNTPIKYNGVDDPKATIGECLEQLAKLHNLSFNINENAFKDVGIKKIARLEIGEQAPIPEMHTRLGTVLKKILGYVSPSATYIIRDDMIEITTSKAIRKEFFADRPHGPLPPLVAGHFEKEPLENAFKELAHSGNIILDSRAAKEAQTPVTADLVNVPLDTAVRMLADMAGLKVVPMDNVYYVTSKDNARLLMEEREKLRLQRQCQKKLKKDRPRDKPDPSKAKTEPGKKAS